MKLKKGSQAAKDYMKSIRAKKKGPKKAAVKKAAVKKLSVVNTIGKINFFEQNINEYNKYNHLTITRNFRGRNQAKLNNKVITLKKAYNLIDKGEFKWFDQQEYGFYFMVFYRKLK